MQPTLGVLVFIPTFNDHAHLADLVRRVAALPLACRALVLDDGSSAPVQPDGLGGGALLARLPDNFGLGMCTHVAFDHALTAGYQYAVRIDADGQHSVEDIPALIAPLAAGQADIVAGSRTNHRAQGGWLRIAIKAYFAATARLMTSGQAPQDVNTGFFAVNRAAMVRLNTFRLERYPEPQMYVLACRNGLRLADVAIAQRERGFGRSSLDSFGAIRMWYRFSVFVLAELLRRRPS